ncbi:unnamed protein product, partial [Rangifer tarandus platyrhynchus]
MPRRHKNKYHVCVKCHQVRWDTQEAQATAVAAPGEEHSNLKKMKSREIPSRKIRACILSPKFICFTQVVSESTDSVRGLWTPIVHSRGKALSPVAKEGTLGGDSPGEERPSSPSSVPQGSPPSSPAAGDPQELQGAMAPSSPDAGPSCAGSDEGAQGPEEESADAAQSALVVRSFRRDPLNRKASMLVEFLLEKYNKKEPIAQNALMKIISSKYKGHFPEILRRASERLELVFGLELKEVDCSRNIYTLTNKFTLGVEEGSRGERGMPKSGLLMALLGIIFMKGNRATEEEVWDFLSLLGIYAGRNHSIFGEPRKLITKDLVEEGYLNYRRVARSDHPPYEFLWGPRAHAETSKMKVLEFLAKVNDTVPSAFSSQYEEALRDEEERARATARPGTTVTSRNIPWPRPAASPTPT